jgi:glycosyltransferase involved in cell wall biosynthesis
MVSTEYFVVTAGIVVNSPGSSVERSSSWLECTTDYRRVNGSMAKIFNASRYSMLLLRLYTKHTPAVIVSCSWFSFLLGSLACKVLPAKHIYYQLEYREPSMVDASWLAKVGARFERRLVAAASKLFSAHPKRSELMRDDYDLNYVPDSILNCPLTRYNVTVAKPSKKLRFVYGGNASARTGLETMLRIIAKTELVEDLTVFGLLSTRECQNLRSAWREGGSRSPLIFAGLVPYAEFQERLLDMDIGIVCYLPQNPNQKFCSPGKLFEYMAAGLAIIGNDVPGVADVLAKTVSGVTVDFDRPVEESAEYLDKIFADPTKVYSMKVRSREGHLSDFNYQHQVQKLLSELSECK